MTPCYPHAAPRRFRGDGFWRKTWAMLLKEFIQLTRDRVSFAMIIMIPLVQLMLFGYAINTNPRHLPTAVLLQEQSDLGRSILAALENTKYFKVTQLPHSEAEVDELLASGKVLFAIEIPANFERAVRRGDKPAMLVEADATDPVAAGTALGALGQVVQTALSHDRAVPGAPTMPFEIRTHRALQPGRRDPAQHRAGPRRHHPHHDHADLHRAVGDARDRARHHGKPAVDADHAGRDHARQDHPLRHSSALCRPALIIGIGVLLFGVPVVGNLPLLAALSTLFIATNLSIGYTFSTVAQNQLQAMQMSMMFFSAEHPALRLHVSLRRHAGLGAIYRRGAAAHALSAHRALDHAQGFGLIGDLRYDAVALLVLMLIAMTIAVTRFRRTLD